MTVSIKLNIAQQRIKHYKEKIMSNCTHTWVGGDLRQSKCSKCGILKEEFFRRKVEEVEAKTIEVAKESKVAEVAKTMYNQKAK
jgi:hypothetical protein